MSAFHKQQGLAYVLNEVMYITLKKLFNFMILLDYDEVDIEHSHCYLNCKYSINKYNIFLVKF